ncbi:MAG: Rpp14/Pop5 family protein [Desulfurococcales archaeon]|nr:Rpp14/Pop5 family protein [Desulfurococcales archaeon]
MNYLATICYGEAVILIVLLILYLDMYRKQKSCSSIFGADPFSQIKTLKEKPRKRYLIIETVNGSNELYKNYRHAVKWLEESFKQIIGEAGLVNSGFTIIDYNPSNRRFIVRVYHHKLDQILGVIGIHNNQNPVKLTVITVTGSVRKAKGARGK